MSPFLGLMILIHKIKRELPEQSLRKAHIVLCGAVWAGQGSTKKTVCHSCPRIMDNSFVQQFDERRSRVVTKLCGCNQNRVTKNMLAEYFDLSSETDSDAKLEILLLFYQKSRKVQLWKSEYMKKKLSLIHI